MKTNMRLLSKFYALVFIAFTLLSSQQVIAQQRDIDIGALTSIIWFVLDADNVSPSVDFQGLEVDFVNLNSRFEAGQPLAVTVDASQPNGGIASVDLFYDGTLVRSEVTPPYQWGLPDQAESDGVFASLTAGNHTLMAVATSLSGLTRTKRLLMKKAKSLQVLLYLDQVQRFLAVYILSLVLVLMMVLQVSKTMSLFTVIQVNKLVRH